MSTTHVPVSQGDLAEIEGKLGKDHGLCRRIRDALTALDDPKLALYRAAAIEQSAAGELETDPGAVVSKGDDRGAYVMAWLWISDEDAGIATGGAP
jgi:hypothetical protein